MFDSAKSPNKLVFAQQLRGLNPSESCDSSSKATTASTCPYPENESSFGSLPNRNSKHGDYVGRGRDTGRIYQGETAQRKPSQPTRHSDDFVSPALRHGSPSISANQTKPKNISNLDITLNYCTSPSLDTTSCLDYDNPLPFRGTPKANCVPSLNDFHGIGAWAETTQYQYEGGSYVQDNLDLGDMHSTAIRPFADYFVFRNEDDNIFRFLP